MDSDLTLLEQNFEPTERLDWLKTRTTTSSREAAMHWVLWPSEHVGLSDGWQNTRGTIVPHWGLVRDTAEFCPARSYEKKIKRPPAVDGDLTVCSEMMDRETIVKPACVNGGRRLKKLNKTALEAPEAMKARPARTSQNNQLELALQNYSNLQICSWDTNSPFRGV